MSLELNDVYPELLVLVSTVGALVDVPIESEHFFSKLAREFHGSKEEFLLFVRTNLRSWFRSIPSSGPTWIQEAEWPFHNGSPMLFVGELSIPKSAHVLHDDARVFVFISDTGVTTNVIQVS